MARFSIATGLPPIFETQAVTKQPELLGEERIEKLFLTRDAVEPVDARDVVFRWCHNDTGGLLLPRRLFKFKAAGYGTVAGALTTTTNIVHGAVNHLIPSTGVPDGHGFWAIIAGPCILENDGNASIAEGAVLIAGLIGQARTGTSGDSLVGQSEASGGSTINTTFRANLTLRFNQ